MTSQTAEALRRGLGAHRRGDLGEAERSYEAVLRSDADNFDALHMLGVIRLQQRRNDEALRLLEAALRRKPRSAEACSNLGIVLQSLGRFSDAVGAYDRAIAVDRRYANAHFGRGNALLAGRDYAAALASFDTALAINPQLVPALLNRGVALRGLARHEEALACYDRVLASAPGHAETLHNRGNSLHALGRYDEALQSYDEALALRPESAEFLNNRGLTLNSLRRHDEALACFERALAAAPKFAIALINAGNALEALGRLDDALARYDQALGIDPDNVEARYNRANALLLANRHTEAIDGYEQVLARDPRHPYALGALFHAAQVGCSWPKVAALAARVDDHVANDGSIITPFTAVSHFADPARQLSCSRFYVRRQVPVMPAALWKQARTARDRIRVAYLSGDFHRHATAYLTAGLFELHDRARFDVIGISFGHDDGSAMRSRLVRAFDRFLDVGAHGDEAIARLVAEQEIDIAVDLKGHTDGARLGIFARRPAPIQVNYLGYPGTMGAAFIDYILADSTVLPGEDEQYYTEKVVRLPDSYQVNDSKRAIASTVPSRSAEGLPEHGLVFCCFNQSYKITEPVFDIWMRLLRRVEASVLWLIRSNDLADTNLRQAAQARGIDANRLIFASKVDLAEHLARHRLADLFVDTLPYNAHTTASDALWAGLPVVTCKGDAFAGRVAASLLQAVGLPELATASLADYESLALALAQEPARLHAVRARLERSRAVCPLFDTDRTRRHIEAAYATMWSLWRSGEEPRSFAVDPIA